MKKIINGKKYDTETVIFMKKSLERWKSEEVRKYYKDRGFWFEPRGYSGGVLQRGEDICW